MTRRDLLDRINRLDLLRGVRNVCLTLGGLGLISAMACVGGIGVGNPENWSSAYVALRASGYMRWLIAPLAAVGIVLTSVSIVLMVFISRETRVITGGKSDEL